MTQWTWVQNIFGNPITTATFDYAAYNNGDGWYYVAVPDNSILTCSAPGFNSYSLNVGTGPSDPNVYIYFQLTYATVTKGENDALPSLPVELTTIHPSQITAEESTGKIMNIQEK